MTAIIRAILKGHIAGVVATRNMFTGNASLMTPDSYGDLVSGYISRLWGHIGAQFSTIVTFETVEVQEYTAGVWVPYAEYVYGNAGTGSGDPLPNAVAAVLVGKCGGLLGHGRKFFSGLTEGAVVGNILSTAAVTAFALGIIDYISSYTTAAGSSFAPGIVDKTGTFHLFITGFVSSLLGSMRRRKPGLGI